jgi:hypothetical protein
MRPRGTNRHRAQYGRIGYWLRQLTPDTGERTLPGVIATILTDGVALDAGGCLALKCADGVDFQGAADSSLPINSVADVVAARDLCWQSGVDFLPVVVPRGADPAAEAQLHGSIFSAVGCGMVDLEPYEGFYYPDQSTIPQYVAALRAASGNAYLIVQPDPRPFGLQDIQFTSIYGAFDGICAQHYVGWTGVGWTDVQAEVQRFTALAALGKDMYVTIYAADPSFPAQNTLPVDFWQAVRGVALGVNVFAFGPMNLAQLQAIQAMPRPAVQPDPLGNQPQPAPDDAAQRIALAQPLAESVAELLDTEQPLSDALPYVQTATQAVLDRIQGG